MRFMRAMQIILGSLFGLVTALLVAVLIARFDTAKPVAVVLPGIFAAMTALILAATEMTIRRLRALDRRTRAVIEECATRVFDAPAAVRQGYDVSVTATPNAAAMAMALDGNLGQTADGEYKGVRLSVASHASRAGRQWGELAHVYSYVCVDVLGATEPFFLTRQGLMGKVATFVGAVKDVKIGIDDFDAAWIVNADEALAKDVLADESIRARLNELTAKVPEVSSNVGTGAMSVILTRHGLAIRWPGAMSVELATFMRDLLMDMRARLLAHLDKRAHAGAGTGYRVADAGEELEQPEAEDQKPMAARS